VALGQFVGQFVLAIWTLNELTQILASFFLTLKWALERRKKKCQWAVGLVESLVTPNSKDYKNSSH
jgi:hypothetical protein